MHNQLCCGATGCASTDCLQEPTSCCCSFQAQTGASKACEKKIRMYCKFSKASSGFRTCTHTHGVRAPRQPRKHWRSTTGCNSPHQQRITKPAVTYEPSACAEVQNGSEHGVVRSWGQSTRMFEPTGPARYVLLQLCTPVAAGLFFLAVAKSWLLRASLRALVHCVV